MSVQNKLSDHCEIYCRVSVGEVYALNDFKPFWKDNRQINEFVRIIQNCEDEGLNPEDYQLSLIKLLRESNLKEARIQLDIVLTDAFLLYTSHLFSGKTDPLTINAKWYITGSGKDIVKYIFDVKKRGVLSVISEIEPSSSNYTGLKRRLKMYRLIKSRGIDWLKIYNGKIIKPGETDHRIIEVRKQLTRLGDYAEEGNIYSDYYDETLKTAVLRFQERHGLEEEGILGKETIEALNTPIEERIKTIEVNLERLRWLPQAFSPYHIIVNIADYNLEVVKNNLVLKNHKVIVGKPYRQTPVFSSTMANIVFNPTWTVPPTILKEDLIPAVRKSRTYLSEKNIHVYNHKGERLNPDFIDWESSHVYGYIFRQEPGYNNALGIVKFMFPNNFSVYLHDTPAKELFSKSLRPFSSGCIRVQNALDLAEFLLKDQPEWDRERIQKLLSTTSETITVRLRSRPDVYLVYLTSWVTDFGDIQFRKDIYERDEKLYNALHATPAEAS